MDKAVETLKVYETKDYSKFGYVKGNRQIKEYHVQALVKDMREEDLHYLDPITVSKSMKIIDGQHRLEARKILGRSVFYIVVEDEATPEQIQTLNGLALNWSRQDFLDSKCALGVKDYMILREFMTIHNLDLTVAISLLSSTSAKSIGHGFKSFKEGKFKILDINTSGKWVKWLKEIGQYYDGFQRRCFVSACIKMFRTKGYDHSRLIAKLYYLSAKLVHCPDTRTYLSLLEKIYNNKQAEETKVRFF